MDGSAHYTDNYWSEEEYHFGGKGPSESVVQLWCLIFTCPVDVDCICTTGIIHLSGL